MRNNNNNYGAKIAVTSIIWAFATGMMALCIPIISISKGDITLPLALVIGTTITTVSIWQSGSHKEINSSENFQQIEQRVRDLETIASSDKLDSVDKHMDKN
ncbi:MAG: hypothetical protein AAF378_20515 [Cyanobacteria bacterium P01_A01_bin.84]